MKWSDLAPEPEMVTALQSADAERPRVEIDAEAKEIDAADLSNAERKRLREPLRDKRKRWSELLADGTAQMVANHLRKHKLITARFDVAPHADGSSRETFVPLGYSKGKRIDVVVFGSLVGLQLGVSLKGLNFRADRGGNYDKNLTGRLYELADEMNIVHRHLPTAFMAGVFFLPVDACFDKTTGASSFAHTVLELRRRSGRQESDPTHLSRCDAGAVALYSWDVQSEHAAPGVVRFFPVEGAPPRRGLPIVANTLSVSEFVGQTLQRAVADTAAGDVYGEAEAAPAIEPNVSALDDVIAAEASGEIDELDLDE